MNKNIINVFKFSFLQTVKNKIFIILTILCGVLMLTITPITIYMSSEMEHNSIKSIEKVYVIDDNKLLNSSGINIVDGECGKASGTRVVECEIIDESFIRYKEEFGKNENNKSALLIHATNKMNKYRLDFYKSKDSKITDKDLTTYSQVFMEEYNRHKLFNMNLEEKQYEIIDTPVITNIEQEGVKNGNKESEGVVIIIVSFVIIFFIVISGESISTQIVTEKSTKLVEFLLVNIRPLELVCGKILASVCVSFIQMMVMVGAGLSSIIVSKRMGFITSVDETLELMKIKDIADKISVIDLVLIILFIVVGFLFYAIIASMLASTVSRLEDLGNINMVFSLILMVSLYAMIGVINFAYGNVWINRLMVLIPFTSVISSPAYIMLGKMDTLFYIIALIIQILFLVVFGMMAAKLYISLIMYNGKKLNVRQLWNIVHKSKVGGVHE